MSESAVLNEPVPDRACRRALANLASGVTAYGAASRYVSVSLFPRYS